METILRFLGVPYTVDWSMNDNGFMAGNILGERGRSICVFLRRRTYAWELDDGGLRQ